MPQHDLFQDHPDTTPAVDMLINNFRSSRSNTPDLDEKNVSPSSRTAGQDFVPPMPKHAQLASEGGAPRFKLSHLWSEPILNPVNLRSYTLPLLRLSSPYCRNPLLATLGFFVAFLSWFAFPPLFPEAITKDLKLTTAQVANSNIVALCATLFMRLITGPAVDRWGPRWVMAAILVAGAIPSGLAAVIKNYQGLLVCRFFIGVLGSTFVPCVAWTTAFFSKESVGTANAISAGWGNAGGGATYAIMVSLFHKFRESKTVHTAWRLSFLAVPVPVLILTAVLVLVFGTDCPTGAWSTRHTTNATAAAVMAGHEVKLDSSEQRTIINKKQEPSTTVQEVSEDDGCLPDVDRPVGVNDTTVIRSDIDVAVNEPLTMKALGKIVSNPLTWLPSLAYMTTFGFELAVDSILANVILKHHPNLGMEKAGYYASVFGLLNIVTRPLGGILADMLYRKFGVGIKKYWMLGLGIGQGVLTIGFGMLLKNEVKPSIGAMMGIIVCLAFFNEMANGANFAIVPHCNSFNNGVMSGLVGAFGNLGGIVFALMFRFLGQGWQGWTYAGVLALAVNCLLLLCPSPKS
ncbi:hypothetical protein NliqN6_1053 [Naganishia liquefaciens]|uniref:Major facilitator superfamily (MFS) profile domain-containing protein n=1 Tax=Naganishia liquefaciens TaxID=104408 RepID=A0A8H3TPP9_9TREE|nr:hypothetical protein NliqN6_1053 [Naganishia liquefaciens]